MFRRGHVNLAAILWAGALVCCWTDTGLATVYYVDSVAGNDQHDGLTPVTAFRTIQRAATMIEPGGECIVAPGEYREKVSISRGGVSGAPVLFRASGVGVVTRGFILQNVEHVTIDGFEITVPLERAWDTWSIGSGISLIDTRECTVSNNRIRHSVREGIMVFGHGAESSSRNIIIGNRIEYAGTYAGVSVTGSEQLIENNEISHTIQHPLFPLLSEQSGADADGIKFSGRGHVFRGNFIHDITIEDAGNVDPHIDAFQTFGPAEDMLFERNVVRLPVSSNSSQAAYISHIESPVRSLVFRYNVFTAYRGINIWGFDERRNRINIIDDVQILNNTFFGVRSYDVELHYCTLSVIANNALSMSGRYLLAGAGTDVSHNCGPPTASLRPHDLAVTDPLFVDAASHNFRLRPGSPLIDAGKNLGLTADFDGAPVPSGAGVDVGAFEFQVALRAFFTAFPTRGNSPLTVWFADKSTADDKIVWRHWEFGDGSTSHLLNPAHTYSEPGSYSVTLSVSTAAGSDSVTMADYVKALPPGTLSAAGVVALVVQVVLLCGLFCVLNVKRRPAGRGLLRVRGSIPPDSDSDFDGAG